MYGNNYNNYNNNARATPTWQNNNNNNNWNTQPMQQTNWGGSPSSPRVTPPPMMGGMGGMPAMDLGMGMNNNMGMGMNNNMGMGMGMPARKQYSDPSQYNSQPPSAAKPYSNNNYNQYGADNLDVNSAGMGMKNVNVNVNLNYSPNGGYNDMKQMGGMGMGMGNNWNQNTMAMTSLAYRTAAFSAPAVPEARGDTQFDGVAPETYNNMQNAFGGAGMYKSSVYTEHASASAQYLRDAVLGVNDGLVSMLLLTLGLAGGGLSTTQVLLAGITGAMAGAISMALGEYIATKSQGQVTQAELKLEKEHLMNHREKELQEVRTFMQELNLEGELLEKCVAAINSRDEAMIRLMMAFEFGFQEELERNPLKAMLTSGALFLTGSLPSVLPYAVTTNTTTALGISIALCVVALFGIGAGKTKVTKGPWLYDGMENLILGAIGGAATFGLGKAYGTGRTVMA